MKESITQTTDYGCWVACFAFVAGLSFDEAAHWLGATGATVHRTSLAYLEQRLLDYGLPYIRKHVQPHLRDRINEEGTILLTKRSKQYPFGHYLVRHNNLWMDPWANMLNNRDIAQAKSGFRAVLPGEPMSALFPIEDN